MRARPRTRRLTAAVLGAALVTALAAPANAATGAERAGLFCDTFPWLCPTDPGTPAPNPTPTTPTSGPTSGPTSAPTAPTGPTATPSPGATPTGTENPAGPTTPGADPTAPADVLAACDTSSAPDGPFRLGSDQAQQAADLIAACQAAQDAAAAAGDPMPKGPTRRVNAVGGQPLVVSPVPTNITATSQTVNGFDYVGIVTLPTADGGSVRVLKFTADSVSISGIRESVTVGGATMTITSGTTVRLSGNVELYVLEQTANIFGLLPLTINPDNPPPLILPFLIFTDVKSKIAYIKADQLVLQRGRIDVT